MRCWRRLQGPNPYFHPYNWPSQGITSQHELDYRPSSEVLRNTSWTLVRDHPDLRGHQPDPTNRDRKEAVQLAFSVHLVLSRVDTRRLDRSKRTVISSTRSPRDLVPGLAETIRCFSERALICSPICAGLTTSEVRDIAAVMARIVLYRSVSGHPGRAADTPMSSKHSMEFD
jgi:hypothetical protein